MWEQEVQVGPLAFRLFRTLLLSGPKWTSEEARQNTRNTHTSFSRTNLEAFWDSKVGSSLKKLKYGGVTLTHSGETN